MKKNYFLLFLFIILIKSSIHAASINHEKKINTVSRIKKNILPALSIGFICYKGIKHRIPALTRIPETCDRFAVGSMASSYMLQILLPDIMREESPCDCNPKPTSLRREIIIFSKGDNPEIGRLIFDPETHVHNKANQNSIFKDAFKKSLELFKKKNSRGVIGIFHDQIEYIIGKNIKTDDESMLSSCEQNIAHYHIKSTSELPFSFDASIFLPIFIMHTLHAIGIETNPHIEIAAHGSETRGIPTDICHDGANKDYQHLNIYLEKNQKKIFFFHYFANVQNLNNSLITSKKISLAFNILSEEEEMGELFPTYKERMARKKLEDARKELNQLKAQEERLEKKKEAIAKFQHGSFTEETKKELLEALALTKNNETGIPEAQIAVLYEEILKKHKDNKEIKE